AVVGLLLGLAGTAIVVSADYSGSADAPAWAYTLPLSAMLCLTAATTLERRVYRRRAAPPTADALAIQCLAAAALFAVPAAGAGALTPPQSTQFWIAVAWVVVLSTFGGYGFYWIVAARSGIVGVSTLLYLTPAATAAWAWAMFGQPVTLLSAAGAAVCAAGVALVLKRGRPGEFATSLPEVEKPPAAAGPADEPWGHAIRRQRQEQQCPIDSNPKSSS
ncbi:MAG: EamA family transporter, partial [Stackebrandtia sp.]